MDTKLKKFSYGLLWVLLIVSVTAAGVNFSIFAAMMEIQRYNMDSDFRHGFYDEDGVWIEYESIWQGDILMEPAEFMDQFTAGGIAAAVCAVTALILLILILVILVLIVLLILVLILILVVVLVVVLVAVLILILVLILIVHNVCP